MPRTPRTVLGLLLLTTVACSRPPDRLPPARNVVLIIIDTLRCDRLDAYGYGRGTTPALDAFAASGITFERAYATAPWTMPSIVSMLTGFYPQRHGVVTMTSKLPDVALTLAEILGQEGFITACVTTNPVLAPTHGLAQGFQLYQTLPTLGYNRSSSAEITREASAVLTRAASSGRRLFLCLNYFDPHHPYLRHPEYGYSRESVKTQPQGPTLRLEEITGNTEAERRFIGDCYDEEVRFTDDAVGDLLRELETSGLADETLVIVTADHGESFWERGWLGHIQSLYEELVHVPLLIRMPTAAAARGRIVRQPTSLLGLSATVLDLLGLDVASRDFQEGSFADLLSADRKRPVDDIFFEVDFVPANPLMAFRTTSKKGLLRGDLKLVRDDRGGDLELYDLQLDPGEKNNLVGRRAKEATALEAALGRRIESAAVGRLASEDVTPSKEQMEKLRSLGYAGGAGGP